MSGHRKRKLIVTGQKPITKMKLRNGGEATIYEVFAKTEGGDYVEEALRAFDELDVGQLIEYTIEPYNHPQHGMSYTLQPPKKEFHRRLREIEEEHEALMRWAESQGFKVQRWSQPQNPPPAPAERVAAEERKRTADEEAAGRFGDDAPWESRDPGDLEKELEESLNPKENDEAAGDSPDVPEQGGGHADADGSPAVDQGDDGAG
jgi:hypothetical protein